MPVALSDGSAAGDTDAGERSGMGLMLTAGKCLLLYFDSIVRCDMMIIHDVMQQRVSVESNGMTSVSQY